MNSKIFAILCAMVYMVRDVTMEIDASMEYSNIVKQVNMQEAIINNLQRRLDKLLEERNMRGEIAQRYRNEGKANCKCKSGPRGAPGPAGPPGPPGPQGLRGEPAIPDDDEACLVIVGKCPAGFTVNTDYGEVIQPLRSVSEIPVHVCCKNTF